MLKPNRKRQSWGSVSVLLLAMVIGLIIGIKDANAYNFNGEHWESTYVWHMGAGCPSFVEQFADNILAKIVPVDVEQSYDWPNVAQDNHSVIYCSDTPPDTALLLPGSDSSSITFDNSDVVAGNAHWYWNGDVILECDIWLHEDIGLLGLFKILSHEVGHCLGLQHSFDFRALMYRTPRVSRAMVDDLAGLSLLYGTCESRVDKDNNILLHADGWMALIYLLQGAWQLDEESLIETECE